MNRHQKFHPNLLLHSTEVVAIINKLISATTILTTNSNINTIKATPQIIAWALVVKVSRHLRIITTATTTIITRW